MLKSVKEKVNCCEGDVETVDCTVVDQYDGDTLTCPWGSVVNGLGVNSGESGLVQLICLKPNVHYILVNCLKLSVFIEMLPLGSGLSTLNLQLSIN